MQWKTINKTWTRLFLILCLGVWLSACGKFTDDGMLLTGDHFNASGSIGELLSYAVDTNRMLYSYLILDSDFGLEGILGRGNLTQASDGTYIPSNDPNASLILIPDTFLVGGIQISHDTMMCFAGVPAISQLYNPEEIAGTYNFISFECAADLDAGVCTSGYESYYGTFFLDPNGIWQACDSGDIDDPNHHPCQGPINSGEWTDSGNGRIQITSSGIEVGTAMFLPSQTNQQILVMDLKDDRPTLGAGPGMLIGIRRQNVSSASLIGTYRFNGSDASYGSMEVTAIDPNIYIEICYDPNKTVHIGALSRNIPWDGWLTSNNDTPTDPNDDTMILILPGRHVFLQTSPVRNDWFHMGGRIPTP